MNYKMPFGLKHPRALFLAVSLTCSAPAVAGLESELLDMAQSMKDHHPLNSEDAQTRGFVSGPRMRVRYEPWEIEQFHIFHVDPPSWNVGCNGMDLHMGAISWIQDSDIEQMLQQFASPSLWIYAAYLALMQVCEPCKQVASQLNKWANELNQGLFFDCEKSADMIANTAINTGETLSGKQLRTEEAARKYATSEDAASTRGEKDPDELTRDAEAGSEVKLVGNHVWDAMSEDRDLANELGNASVNITDADELKYLIMSLTGVYIDRFEGDGSMSDFEEGPTPPDFGKFLYGGDIKVPGCASGMPSNASSQPGMDGAGNGYNQSVGQCRWMLSENVDPADNGTDLATISLPNMFDQAWEILDPQASDSIFHMMQVHNSADTLDDDHVAFVDNSGFPLIKYARDYAMGGELPPTYQVQAIAKIIATEQALSFLINVIQAAHKMTKDIEDIREPVRKALTEARDAYVDEATRIIDQEMTILEANKLISNTAMENLKRRMNKDM